MKEFKITIYFCLFFGTLITLSAQDEPPGFKNWYSVGVEVRQTPKFKIKIRQLLGFNTNISTINKPYELQFASFTIAGDYRINKKTSIEAGYKPLYFKTNTDFILIHKFYTKAKWRNKFFGNSFNQYLSLEWFTPQQKKYSGRGVYTASYSFKNKLLPWKGKPYLKGQIYYYFGGKPLTYYGSNEEVLAIQAPNGFHRMRLIAGVSMRPNKSIGLNFYYLYQREFNTPFLASRDLNIPSKKGTKIKYPFNNYSLIAISLTYKLKSY